MQSLKITWKDVFEVSQNKKKSTEQHAKSEPIYVSYMHKSACVS